MLLLRSYIRAIARSPNLPLLIVLFWGSSEYSSYYIANNSQKFIGQAYAFGLFAILVECQNPPLATMSASFSVAS